LTKPQSEFKVLNVTGICVFLYTRGREDILLLQ